MKIIRHLIYYASYYGLLLLAILRYVWFLPFLKPYTVGWLFSKNARTLMWIIEKTLGLSYRVKGKENIPQDRRVIIVSKHQSGWEAAALPAILPPHVFIVKRELIFIPLAGLVCMATNQIWIDRKKSNANKLLQEQVKERFGYGLSLCIFPEGTRTKPGDHHTVYKTGAAHLAQQLKIDLLPVALNTGEFFSKGFFKEPGVATFSICPPISWDAAETPQELMQLVKETIEAEQKTIEGAGPLFSSKK
ncbi:MAG: lysophospholipid acyltransferase family protein [Neisseriaceae bacterium]